MIIISTNRNALEKIDYWFAVDPDSKDMPFLFGANSTDQALPSVVTWSAASGFNLETIEHIGGRLWQDWRAALGLCGAPWAVEVLEAALENKDLATALEQIQNRKPQSA